MFVSKLKLSAAMLGAYFTGKALGAWEMGGDISCHDPSIIQEDNRWYAFCTGDGKV